MTFAKDDLIAALRLRYDYYSAANVFDTARERASIADKPAFDPADVRAIRDVLPQCGDRLTAVLDRFDELLDAAPAGKDGGAPKKDDKKAEAPKAEVKAEKSDKAEAPKAEDKKADEAPKAPVEVKAEKSDKTDAKADDAPKADDKKADAAS